MAINQYSIRLNKKKKKIHKTPEQKLIFPMFNARLQHCHADAPGDCSTHQARCLHGHLHPITAPPAAGSAAPDTFMLTDQRHLSSLLVLHRN